MSRDLKQAGQSNATLLFKLDDDDKVLRMWDQHK